MTRFTLLAWVFCGALAAIPLPVLGDSQLFTAHTATLAEILAGHVGKETPGLEDPGSTAGYFNAPRSYKPAAGYASAYTEQAACVVDKMDACDELYAQGSSCVSTKVPPCVQGACKDPTTPNTLFLDAPACCTKGSVAQRTVCWHKMKRVMHAMEPAKQWGACTVQKEMLRCRQMGQGIIAGRMLLHAMATQLYELGGGGEAVQTEAVRKILAMCPTGMASGECAGAMLKASPMDCNDDDDGGGEDDGDPDTAGRHRRRRLLRAN
jgi:hypothetical protein